MQQRRCCNDSWVHHREPLHARIAAGSVMAKCVYYLCTFCWHILRAELKRMKFYKHILINVVYRSVGRGYDCILSQSIQALPSRSCSCHRAGGARFRSESLARHSSVCVHVFQKQRKVGDFCASERGSPLHGELRYGAFDSKSRIIEVASLIYSLQ